MAFVTAGCSFRNVPIPFTIPASPLEIPSREGCIALVKAVLMLLLACVHFWSRVCAVAAVLESVPLATSREPVSVSTLIAPLRMAFAISTPALLPNVSTARAVASAVLSMFAISLITDCSAVPASRPSSEKFLTAVRIAVMAVVPVIPYSSSCANREIALSSDSPISWKEAAPVMRLLLKVSTEIPEICPA